MADHDDSGFARTMLENKRGANDFWYWKDKPVMEAGIARTVLESAGRQFEQLRSRGREDPPDCEAIIEGLRYGIEVTELADETTLKASIKGNHQILLWGCDQLCAELQKRIDRRMSLRRKSRTVPMIDTCSSLRRTRPPSTPKGSNNSWREKGFARLSSRTCFSVFRMIRV
jgi:hypothetical protein